VIVAKSKPAAKKTFQARHTLARISPTKVRAVADLVRGKTAEDALLLLAYEPRRGGPMLRKVIKSAMDNAMTDLDVKRHRLVVVEAHVDQGPLLSGRKRWRPVGMGRAHPIRKRTSHITVRLQEAGEEA
jgi:large subunit ribosomal protein L22